MSFTFKFTVDYSKLNEMLDNFLKQHDKELTSMLGNCLMLQKGGGDDNSDKDSISVPGPLSTSIPQNTNTDRDYLVNKIEEQIDHKVEGRPLIGDSIPEDPFSNMFHAVNANSKTTRIGDRKS